MKKRGRPKSENPKDTLVMVKMTRDERDRIKKAAARVGLSMSAYLRRESPRLRARGLEA